VAAVVRKEKPVISLGSIKRWLLIDPSGNLVKVLVAFESAGGSPADAALGLGKFA
jgi:hypothetical protein